MNEEILRIHRMTAEGKIRPEEAAKLVTSLLESTNTQIGLAEKECTQNSLILSIILEFRKKSKLLFYMAVILLSLGAITFLIQLRSRITSREIIAK
jgi:hypothetical protein